VCRYADCHYDECRYVECGYAECHYAECPGANTLAYYDNLCITDKKYNDIWPWLHKETDA